MRKTILIGIMVIILTVTCISTVKATVATAALRANHSKVKIGDTVTVTISIDSDESLQSIGGKEMDGFLINYDDTKLELTSREEFNRFFDLNFETDENTGKRITEAVLLMGGDSSFKSGDVYAVTFKVKDNAELGNTTISTSNLILLANSDGDDSEGTEIPGGSVNIEIATETTPSDDNNQTNPDTTPSNTDNNTNNNSNNNNNSNSNSNSNTKTINGKTDTTTTSKIIPKTGLGRTFAALGFVALVVTAVVLYRKVNGYKDIR